MLFSILPIETNDNGTSTNAHAQTYTTQRQKDTRKPSTSFVESRLVPRLSTGEESQGNSSWYNTVTFRGTTYSFLNTKFVFMDSRTI